MTERSPHHLPFFRAAALGCALAVSAGAAADEGTKWLTASWRDGLQIQTSDGDYRVHVGGIVQADGHYFPGNTTPGVTDQFLLRRARIELEGTIGRYVNFRLLPDFAGGQAKIYDAYAELALFSWLNLRFGKFKVPFDLEVLQRVANLEFMERGLTVNLSPRRDIGLTIWGDVGHGILQYAFGVFNGNGDNSISDVPITGDQDFVVRLFSHPFAKTHITALREFGFGGAFTGGQARGSANVTTPFGVTASAGNPNLPSDLTDGQNVFFKYRSGFSVDDTAIAAGYRFRANAQAYYYWNRLGLLGEYVWNRQDVRFTVTKASVVRQAWQVYGTFLLTKDHASYNGVKPHRPLQLLGPSKGPGAWEIGFRYSGLTVDQLAFDDGFADITKVANSANEYTVGLNWYINANAKMQFNYTHTDFTGGAKGSKFDSTGAVVGGNRNSEEALMARFQFAI
jgi:phosphate-selective porin OprO/OprP